MKPIDFFIDLHTYLEVIYIVDGFVAQLVKEDETTIDAASGKTVQEALDELTKSLNSQ